MKKLLLATLLLAAACSADNTPPALHGANPSSTGPAPVAATGQDACYNTSGDLIDCEGTGQDGELQKGVPLPTPRFTDNGDGTVTDNLTGLMWTKVADCIRTYNPGLDSDGIVTWQQALDFAAGVNGGTYGCNITTTYTDWRLPNRNELASLINIKYYWPSVSNRAGTGKWTDGDPFNGTIDSIPYWTSTTYADSTNNAWYVNLAYGEINCTDKVASARVWLVRTATANAPAVPAATGQTSCYDSSGTQRACANTGEDGELQKGVPIPSPRFTDNGDGTVTDNLTGLMWLKEANCLGNRLPALDNDGDSGDGQVTWQHGLDFVAGLNYGAHDCGQTAKYTDWRMPNHRELSSLVNVKYAFPAISNTAGDGKWSEGDPFTGVVRVEGADIFWTSDSVTAQENNAITVNMDHGAIQNLISSLKTDAYLVWPVRGGN